MKANPTCQQAFSVFEAFSFLLDDGLALGTPTNDDDLHHPQPLKRKKCMSKETIHRHKVLEEVAKFQKNMEELQLLRTVSNDLKHYRRMIRIKRND